MRAWNELSMAEKADVMKLAIDGGVYDLDAIRNGYNEYAKGGKIHIAPSKRGTFTAAASKHGKSVQAFASQVLAHPENYSPAMRKKANFARNAAKWKHAYGGELGNYYLGLGDIPNFLKKGWNKLKDVVQTSAVVDNPAIMTASGQKVNKQGQVEYNHVNDEEIKRLRSNLTNLGEGALSAVTATGDIEAAYNIARHPVRTVRALKTGTKKIAAEIADKINPQSVISDNDAHVLAADAKYAIKKYINSGQERGRIKAALRRNGENGSHADFEIGEMNSNLNKAKLSLEPQVYSKGDPVNGVTIRKGNNIDVKLTTNRESPDDLLFSGEHEYGHVTETDKILELLEKEWGKLEVNPKYYTENGVENLVLKEYYTGIPENRTMALSIQADMYDKGIPTLDKYIEYLENNKMTNEQWTRLKDLHGENKAKHLVETVFGLSPLVYMGTKNK